MVMLRIFRYLTVFYGFCLIISCYFIHTVNLIYNTDNNGDGLSETTTVFGKTHVMKNSDSTIAKTKRIVAYSLLKQIENESEEYFCEKFRFENGDFNVVSQEKMWTRIENVEIYVFSVHFDERLKPFNFLRIIAMSKGFPTSFSPLFCQISNANSTYTFVKAVITPIWSEEWTLGQNNETYFEPVLISCRVQMETTPNLVSLSTSPCTKQRNMFEIKQKRTRTNQRFTVCVKPLNFHTDISLKLLQWIIMNQILGADKIIIYFHSVRRRTQTFLEWLEKGNLSSLVDVRHFKHIDGIKYVEPTRKVDVNSVWQKRKYEIISYNDCFYRSLSSEYIIPLDLDEIIVPKRENTSNWKDLFDSLSAEFRGNFASFSVRNAYYFNEYQTAGSSDKPVFFFGRTMRSKLSDSGESGKSFVSSKNSLTVFNHYTLHTLKPGISRIHFMSNKAVQLNHYRNKCDIVILPECEKYISSQRFVDRTIFKYKKQFESVYYTYLNYLKFVKIL